MQNKVEEKKAIIPPQETGARKDIEHVVTAADEKDGRKLFVIARNRLVSVNQWHEYAAPITGTFRLTDQSGNEVDRTAEMGDYFKIDIPAPGSSAGKGYDWVRIEAIEDARDPNGMDEIIAMRVRPAANPKEPETNVAHFFDDESTSSFVVERHGREVKASVYGRNEKPNIKTENIIDKVRNAVVGTTAILGFSNIQWRNLVKGLLD